MKNITLIGLSLLLLVLQAAFATLIPLHAYAPNLMLPIVIFLGISPEAPLVRGAVIAFVLGYLLDAFCGSPVGLQTLVMVAVFMFVREVGLRLFFRGQLFQLVLTFAMALIAGGIVLALRTIFEKDVFENIRDMQVDEFRVTLGSMAKSAVATTMVAPLIFAVVGRVEGIAALRGEEGPASR